MISLKQNGPLISYILNQKLYINDCNPNKISIHDTSRLKVGRNSFHNRLKCLKCIWVDWKDMTPYPQNESKENFFQLKIPSNLQFTNIHLWPLFFRLSNLFWFLKCFIFIFFTLLYCTSMSKFLWFVSFVVFALEKILVITL